MALNSRQQQAVDSLDGFSCIIAGAGTGKTFTLVSMVSSLLNRGIRPERILLLTFTNKAADEMKERIGNDRIPAMTYHSFGAKFLRKNAKAIGLRRNFTIISGDDVAESVALAMGDTEMPKDFPDSTKIAAVVSRVANTGETYAEACSDLGIQHKYAEAVEDIGRRYAAYKLRHSLVDFDDLLVYTKLILMTNEDIRKETEESYDYILVDEYQDTNTVQDDIVFLIRRENHNLAVVGDDAQSIYRFRGADVGNILSFPKRTGCTPIVLDHNYRSTEEILDVSNAVMKNNYTGHDKTLFSKEHGIEPKYLRVWDFDAEVATVTKDIASKRDSGETFCVLSRYSRSFDAMEASLMTRGISCTRRGGPSLTENNSVKNFLSFFRLAFNPKDIIAECRIYRLIYGIGNKKSLDIAEGRAEDVPGVENARTAVQMMRDNEEDAAKIARETYYTMCRKKIDDACEKSTAADREDRRLRNLVRLEASMAKVDSVVKAYEGSLRDFIDALDYTPDDEDAQVVLSTIHSAKGLEFDNVYILDVYQGMFPDWHNDPETLRCFYVALTRAKKSLVLLSPKRCMTLKGKPYWTKESDYIKNIKDTLDEKGGKSQKSRNTKRTSTQEKGENSQSYISF